ncbi:MAG: DNA internalization-related competence protein ComEC/Rec2, partial [Chromatiales bacterium]|nr:DNA internalization-related competence protein ComEC/Rec2 [Chromatiales bacterium]
QPARLLAIVLLLVVLHDPLVVLSAGFWLSFGAVAIILFGMSGRLNPAGLWWRWGRVQWLVALGLSPLLLLLFGQAALVAPLANLIAVPLVGLVVVPLTLSGTLLLNVWSAAGEVMLQLASWGMAILWPVLEHLADTVPTLRQATAPWWLYLFAFGGAGWLLAPRGWPLRWAGMVPLLPLLLWQPPLLKDGVARFTLLDVGQGLAAVVETRHHLLVFDTGPRFESGFDTGEAVVLPYLRYRGYGAIDTLIISHGDNDHIGGARGLSEGVSVKRVLTSVPEKMGWTSHEVCHRDDSWVWDGVEFRILHPRRLLGGGRGNNDSCVLQVVAGEERLLLTGDIEVETERELVAFYGNDLGSDILVVPHHGSKTSSSEQFINVVKPRVVLLPLGYRNRYGFPHKQVVDRYTGLNSVILSSSDSGAMIMYLGEGQEEIVEYRSAARRYWHSSKK